MSGQELDHHVCNVRKLQLSLLRVPMLMVIMMTCLRHTLGAAPLGATSG